MFYSSGIKLPGLLKRNRSSSKGPVEVQPQTKPEQGEQYLICKCIL